LGVGMSSDGWGGCGCGWGVWVLGGVFRGDLGCLAGVKGCVVVVWVFVVW